MSAETDAWLVNRRLKPCDNPLCDRRTTAMYCCAACDYAHAHHFEIHEDGILGHAESCNQRHAERQGARL